MSRGIRRLAALGGLALAVLACNAEPLDVAPNVDLSRFQGKWYEIARLPRTTQTDCHGTTAFYSQASDGALTLVNQCNVGSQTGPVKTVAMSASVPDSTVPAKLALDVGGYTGDYWILEVGSTYEYAVVGHPSRLYFWILSRTPTLDTPTVQGIVSRAQSKHFDMTQLEYTPQPPPGERTASDSPVGSVPPPLTTGCAMSGAQSEGHGLASLGLALGVVAVLQARSGRSRARGPLRDVRT
jgi:apolipoprotein D and lipocalin family protein